MPAERRICCIRQTHKNYLLDNISVGQNEQYLGISAILFHGYMPQCHNVHSAKEVRMPVTKDMLLQNDVRAKLKLLNFCIAWALLLKVFKIAISSLSGKQNVKVYQDH